MRSIGVTILNVWKSFTDPESRVLHGADAEDCVILVRVISTQYSRAPSTWTDASVIIANAMT